MMVTSILPPALESLTAVEEIWRKFQLASTKILLLLSLADNKISDMSPHDLTEIYDSPKSQPDKP